MRSVQDIEFGDSDLAFGQVMLLTRSCAVPCCFLEYPITLIGVTCKHQGTFWCILTDNDQLTSNQMQQLAAQLLSKRHWSSTKDCSNICKGSCMGVRNFRSRFRQQTLERMD